MSGFSAEACQKESNDFSDLSIRTELNLFWYTRWRGVSLDTKDKIEKLFDEETIVRTSSEEEVRHPEPDERREFSRAGLSPDAIQLQFGHAAQFAKHYVENISLGGMFIRSSEKKKQGELIDISFSIPDESQGRVQFQLRAKVCRITPEGLGVEFVNLNVEMRDRLEKYVQKILPKGAEIRTKAKKSTIERLEQSRARRQEQGRQQREWLQKLAALGVLLLLNFYLGFEVLKETEKRRHFNSVDHQIQIRDETFSPNELRGIERSPDGDIVLRLADDRSILLSQNSTDFDKLPPDYQQAISIMRTMPAPSPIRTSKNNPNHRIQMR